MRGSSSAGPQPGLGISLDRSGLDAEPFLGEDELVAWRKMGEFAPLGFNAAHAGEHEGGGNGIESEGLGLGDTVDAGLDDTHLAGLEWRSGILGRVAGHRYANG